MTIRELKNISMVSIKEVVIENENGYQTFDYDFLIKQFGAEFKDKLVVLEFEPMIMTSKTGQDELKIYTCLRVYAKER